MPVSGSYGDRRSCMGGPAARQRGGSRCSRSSRRRSWQPGSPTCAGRRRSHSWRATSGAPGGGPAAGRGSSRPTRHSRPAGQSAPGFRPGDEHPAVSRRDDMLENVSSRLISAAFIGRQAQLADLAAALATATDGEPATVLLGGEAGVGKSRLIAEFAGQARAQGARVLIGGCQQLGTEALPFAPFTAVIRDLAREDGTAAVIELLGGRVGEIARLLPELDAPEPEPAVLAGSGSDAYSGDGRGRLFGQMLALLQQLGEHGPVVLGIEDLHWAGNSTRDLLTFLICNQRVLPGVLIIGSFRSDELHRTHPLLPWLAGLDRLGWAQRAEVPRLTRRETAGLLAALLGREVEPARADSVFSRSEGNPLYAEELACCEKYPPGSLRDLVLARARRFPPATQDVLRIAGAGGEHARHAL